jgi:hypothetical protein
MGQLSVPVAVFPGMHQGSCQGIYGRGDAYGNARVGYGGKPELLTISLVGC